MSAEAYHQVIWIKELAAIAMLIWFIKPEEEKLKKQMLFRVDINITLWYNKNQEWKIKE